MGRTPHSKHSTVWPRYRPLATRRRHGRKKPSAQGPSIRLLRSSCCYDKQFSHRGAVIFAGNAARPCSVILYRPKLGPASAHTSIHPFRTMPAIVFVPVKAMTV
jgi:hypothetical protein